MEINSKQAISEIMAFCYDGRLRGWCKALEIEALISKRLFYNYSLNHAFSEKELDQLLSLDKLSQKQLELKRYYNDKASKLDVTLLKEVFLENLSAFVPEDSAWNALNHAKWDLSKNNNHLPIIEDIITTSHNRIRDEQEENLEVIRNVLFYNLEIESFNDPKTERPEVKEIIDKYFNGLGVYYGKDGLPNGIFKDYDRLRDLFLHHLFDLDSVKYFINHNLPAVIGIDKITIGIFWMN